MNENDDNLYDCFEVHFNTFAYDEISKINSPEAALEIFKEHHAKRVDGSFEQYSNVHGHFAQNGFQNIRGIMTGMKDALFGEGKEPVVYVIFERTKDDEYDPIIWCLQAYMYVRGTIEYVLAQPNKEHFRLAWSG